MSIYSMRGNFRKRWTILRELWAPFTKNSISTHAAGTCFYILLSLLPGIALGLTVLSASPAASRELVLQINNILPDALQPMAEYFISMIKPRNPAALLSLWAFLTLWSAAKGIMAMTDGMAAVLNCKEHKGFFRRRFHAMTTLLLLAVVLMGTLAINVFGKRLLSYYDHTFPQLYGTLLLLYKLRHLYSLLVLSLFLALMYWLLPGRPLPFRRCLQSGLFSSAAWILASTGFSIYVNHFQSYQRLYGSLGLLLLASLWLQICISMLLYGVLLGKLVREKSYHPIQIMKRLFS